MLAGGRFKFGKNLVDGMKRCIDMFQLQDEWRQETQHGFIGAIDDDLSREELCEQGLGEFGRIDLSGEHQAFAANVDEGRMLRLQSGEAVFEVVAHGGDVIEEVVRFISSMTAMATAQASGPPPKVVPCMPG